MSESKKFHIGDILSVTTGLLLSPRGMEGLQDILSYMCNTGVVSHGLKRTAIVCKPFLLAQHPLLVEETRDGITPENQRVFVTAAIFRHGEMLDVSPLPASDRKVTGDRA